MHARDVVVPGFVVPGFVALTLIGPPSVPGQTPAGIKIAPRSIDELRSGSMLICGGGKLPQSILDSFVAAAGGTKARIVVIPTASARADDDADWPGPFADYEVASMVTLHTRDRQRADSAEFIAPLRQATGVWFGGGQQSRLRKAYRGTKTEAAIHAVLDRGGIVGGSSAGAAIQTSVMIESGNSDPALETGFDLLPGCIVDQHFTARKRMLRLLRAVQAHPSRVGLGIDEKTALLVRGRRIHVIGDAGVTVVLAGSHERKVMTAVHKARPLDSRRPDLDLVSLRRAARLRASGTDHAHDPARPVVPKGTLILVGGGAVPRGVWQRFVAAAGGNAASIVVVPTASGSARSGRRTVALLRGMGVKSVTLLHETQRAKIETDEFLAPLRRATGIWFGGGRQWRLVDAYEGTGALPLFHDVLQRGGVIAGSSAGTSIQGEFMVRGNPLGNLEVFIEGYEKGFGFFPGAAIDQHFSQRRRRPDLELLMRTYPKLLGIGIDESTAIIVQKAAFEVVGRHQVTVCQDGEWAVLRAGQSYDMGQKARKK